MVGELRVIPVRGIGEVVPGDDLVGVITEALRQQGQALHDDDIVVITQKIVSKAEGQLVDPASVVPSTLAQQAATQGPKDAHYYEVVLRETRRIVRMDRGVLIVETHHGFICANAGVDESNVAGGRVLALLPQDPDGSAQAIRQALHERSGVRVAVIISDTWGRPWREGQINVAIGVAGMAALSDYRGQRDPYGYELGVSALATADELAGAAELVMGKIDQVPVAIIRGYAFAPAAGSGRDLLRDGRTDLFR
jgi:coenzyme F420-0:L-glutamate ligase / coenzyme F420-1:gamma-L-glutamate ligase